MGAWELTTVGDVKRTEKSAGRLRPSLEKDGRSTDGSLLFCLFLHFFVQNVVNSTFLRHQADFCRQNCARKVFSETSLNCSKGLSSLTGTFNDHKQMLGREITW